MSAEMILLKESYEKYRKENAGKKLQEKSCRSWLWSGMKKQERIVWL